MINSSGSGTVGSRLGGLRTGGLQIGRLRTGIMAMGALLAATPALAQVGPERQEQVTRVVPAAPSVEGYVCKFTGKCGPQVIERAERQAPGRRGFKIGRQQTLTAPVAVPVAPAYTGRRPTNRYVGSGRTVNTPGRGRSPYRPAASAAVAGASTIASTGVASQTYAPIAGATANPGAGQTSAPRADLMIGFELNSAQLSASGRRSARVFAQSMKHPALSSARFLVEGHTDLRGARELNIDLSQRRARAVIDFLAAQGVDRSRLAARGLGPDMPLPGRTKEDPANRRVEAELMR